MMKKSMAIGVIVTLMLGCGGGSDRTTDGTQTGEKRQGVSSANGGDKTFGSFSEGEDIVLVDTNWKSLTLDLDKFLYDNKGRQKSYDVEMRFGTRKVDVLADCYLISAQYKLRDGEISFSKVSAPKPAIDIPTCREFANADNAVSAFFNYTYTVSAPKNGTTLFEGTDIETSVTLKR